MWTILRYRFICIFHVLKIFFLPFFLCKNKLSLLVSTVRIAVAIVFGTKIAFIIYESGQSLLWYHYISCL